MITKSQQILFLYLNTGNGHKSIANIVKKEIEQNQEFAQTNGEIFLEHGFDSKQKLTTTFFEGGYRLSIEFIPGAYSVFYEVNCNPAILNITKHFTIFGNVKHLKRLIEQYHITKIVSFHFAVSVIAERAIRLYTPGIPLINVVTDPYTAHPSWFLTKKAGYVFFSRQLAKKCVTSYHIDNYTIQSFPVNPEFTNRMHQIKDSKTFNVLIAGGGEGLRGASLITELFARKNDDIKITVICGRNKKLKQLLQLVKSTNKKFNLTILGFVSNMPKLMADADCIISKGGASTVHEVLASGKPCIISQYIHGQELGNMRFVKDTNCGWFLQKPRTIYKKVLELKENPEYYEQICQNIAKVNIHSDLSGITDYILNF